MTNLNNDLYKTQLYQLSEPEEINLKVSNLKIEKAFLSVFSHIYIEKDVLNHPNTQNILNQYKDATIIEINHYKDIFNRSKQSYTLQKQTPKLILAKKQAPYMYEGAPVCQSFGNQHFYYTSSVMNCIYDCEYCYLQGMYPSANLVVFVNLEDIFKEIEELLKKHPLYLCISYDTDLLALEHILGYVKEWCSFASLHPDLTIEIRTKCANWNALSKLEPQNNVIFAWTLSPNEIARNYEHHTPSLQQRICCIQKALDKGFLIRLCFDPIIYTKNWKTLYEDFIKTIFTEINAERVLDMSLGVFRISHDYLKQMRKQRKDSVIVWYPFHNDNGVYHYGKSISDEMISYTSQLINRYIPSEKIFIWKEMN